MLLSTTSRCIGGRDDLDHFFAFLDSVKESEFHGVSLAFSEIAGLLEKDFNIEAFTKRFLGYGLFAHADHAPMYYPFIYNQTDGKAWERTMMTALNTAAACGATSFVMHLGTIVDEDMRYLIEPSKERNITYLRPYLEQAVKLGVCIAVENGTNQPWDIGSPLKDVSPNIEELIEITDTLNREFGKESCGICFDFGHANVAHLDIPAAIEKIGCRLKVVHIHDNDGSSDQHLLPFEGNIDWPAAMAALKKIGFDGELTLELYAYETENFAHDFVGYLNHTYQVLKELLY